MVAQDRARRFKNFDAIRLAAAASVIFCHAFVIAGFEKSEPFVQVGIYGVFVFLIVSGFLVTDSLNRSNSISTYAWKRALRIYPALACCAIVTVFIIAPFFWTQDLTYYQSKEGPLHLFGVLTLQNPTWIPGVMFYDELGPELGSATNASLWTINQEIKCYILLAIIAAVGLLRLKLVLCLLLMAIVLFALEYWGPQKIFHDFLYVLPSFLAGVAMYFIYNRFGISRWIVVAATLGLIVAGLTGWLLVVFPIFGTYLVVALGTSRSVSIGDAARYGDISYGAYLYGWPIQQVLRGMMGDAATWWALFFPALLIAFVCGWISWHLVEKRALSLKSIDPVSALARFFRRPLPQSPIGALAIVDELSPTPSQTSNLSTLETVRSPHG